MTDILEFSDLIQGDTGDLWEVGLPTYDVDGNKNGLVDLTGYSCRVREPNSSLDRAVTVKNTANNRFQVQLTPTETASLQADKVITIRVKISNLSLLPVPFVKTGKITLTIEDDELE